MSVVPINGGRPRKGSAVPAAKPLTADEIIRREVDFAFALSRQIREWSAEKLAEQAEAYERLVSEYASAAPNQDGKICRTLTWLAGQYAVRVMVYRAAAAERGR